MKRMAWLAVAAVLMTGCATTAAQMLDAGTNQVAVRQIQTRVFDTTDSETVLRATIATLQDLGFVVDAADISLGTVSATKLDGYAMRMTVSVRPRGETQLLVRASAQYEDTPILNPEPYQAFFVALEKALFLKANEVD